MKSVLLTILVCMPISLIAQSGNIVLVGGGTERNAAWSWSNTPYKWAVEQSTNKKVAIISYNLGGEPEWLPDYFKSLGAVEATNFEINTIDSANSQHTYDALMEYDVLFFKGGNQWNYYNTYQSSKVTEAVSDKYTDGEVIAGTSAGMAILSSVLFTAEQNTVYPDQVLENINHENIVLENDFLNILNGYLTDTHFIQRGRFARLIGFLGHWYLNNEELITGIGVDDQTAFCIDENLIGTAYGTGSVSIFDIDDFSMNDGKPIADSVHATQLLHGHSYDLSAKSMTTDFQRNTSPALTEEKGNYTIYLSGSNPLNSNLQMLDSLVKGIDSNIILITQPNSSLASSYSDHLSDDLDMEVITIVTGDHDACELVTERNAIRAADAYLFVDNDHSSIMSYLDATTTGKLLSKHLFKNNNTIAFIGENARLAGATFCDNDSNDDLNSYYGELTFSEGIGLLKSTTVMPDTFDPTEDDYYENKSSAVTYAMMEQRIRYGIYLNENSFIKYYQNDDQNWMDGFGEYSPILATNISTKGDLADQQVNSSGDNRNVVGFDNLQYNLMHHSPVKVGATESTAAFSGSMEIETPMNFKAEKTDATVQLTWDKVGSNAQEIVIERKNAGTDYTILTTLASDATEYTDETNESGKIYQYRLQAVNDDTVSCYVESNEIQIVTSLDKSAPENWLYPNPVYAGYIIVNGPDASSLLTVSIYNLLGDKMIESANYTQGTPIYLDGLNSGLYLVSLKRDGELILKQKVLVVNS